MKKLRHRKKNISKSESYDEESDECDYLECMSLRIKNSKMKYKVKESQVGNDEYDADSEPDSVKFDGAGGVSISNDGSITSNGEKTRQKKKKKIKDLYKTIHECYVNVKDCKVLKESPNKFTKIKKYSVTELANANSIRVSSSTEKKGSGNKRKIHKENITPPDGHIPSNYEKVVRNLDNSTFGFDTVEKKLEYSAASSINETTDSKMADVSINKEKLTSYSKRKFETEDNPELQFEVPNEASKKRTRRKKNPKAESRLPNEEFWENLRLQFEEVEMHELVVEDC